MEGDGGDEIGEEGDGRYGDRGWRWGIMVVMVDCDCDCD